jgi:isopenicillin-N N-acyltransferase-like protein
MGDDVPRHRREGAVTFPHVRIEGDARERGRSYGEQARDRVRRSIEAYRYVFDAYAGWNWDEVRDHAHAYEQPIERFEPAYLEEMRGIAEGAAVDAEDILAINVRTEVMFAAKAREASEQRIGECSAFAVTPGRSVNGHTLIGQNWDWLLHSAETVVVLEAEQEGRPDYVTVVEAGLLAKTGMNSSGIGLTTNALVSDADRGTPGVPYHVALRAILDAETISDAFGALQRAARSSSANYLVAHADGLAVDIEGAPGDLGQLFLTFPSDGVLLHTNHFTSGRFAGVDVGLWVMPDSPFRLHRLTEQVSPMPHLSLDDFRTALADHANHPSGICCHPDPRWDPLEQGETVASVLMDLDAKRMWVADGRPCTSPYEELDYSTFLAKAPAVLDAAPSPG